MKNARLTKKITSLMLAIVTIMICIVSVSAETYDSDPVIFPVKGTEYKVNSTLYQRGRSSFQGAVWITTVDQSIVPAQSMRAMAQLFDTNGEVVHSTEWAFNKKADYWIYAITTEYWKLPYVCAGGKVEFYNGTDYEPHKAPKTRYNPESRAIAEKLKLELEATNGDYPKTVQGKTYGSTLLAGIVGYEPDLITARGTNGLSGYVKKEDLYPELTTEADFQEYEVTLEENEGKIPLYDLEGNVIGDFKMTKSEVVVPDAESPEVVRKALEMKMNENRSSDSRFEDARAYYEAKSSAFHNNSEGVLPELILGPQDDDEEPGLMAVRGTNGRSGFVKEEDYNPLSLCKSKEEIDEYFRKCEEGKDRTVPVYDLEGNVIDEFTFHKSEKLFE